MKTRAALIVLLLAVLLPKLYIAIFKCQDTRDFHPKIAQSDLLWTENKASLIIDQNVSVLVEPQNFKEPLTSGIYILILSAPKNILQRSLTRQILSDALSSHKWAFEWAFIIGQTSQEIQEALNEEMHQHGDILQISVQDSYYNLSYKSLAGFAILWRRFGQELKWIIKLDDDLDMQINTVLDTLASVSSSQEYIYCHAFFRNTPPVRSNINKVVNDPKKALSLWPWDKYPDYCSGLLYALRPQVAIKLVLMSRVTPLLPLDDIFITGILRDRLDEPKLGLKLIRSYGCGSNSVIEWLLNCPVLGVAYWAFWQDIAYERGHWPWVMLRKLGCIVLEHYLGLKKCEI